MSPVHIKLPRISTLKSVRNLLVEMRDGDAIDASEVHLDMGSVQFYEPVAIATCLAKVCRWRREDRKHVTVENHLSAEAAGFLSRIDFFRELGIEVPDTRGRRNSAGRFIPVKRITRTTDCDKLAREISECVIPGTASDDEELRHLIEYAIGEVVKNCQQHSQGTGFLSAQFFSKKGAVQIGMADDGMGILESYRSNGAPAYREGMTDCDMIEEALKVRSSSKTHRPYDSPYGGTVNQGIGLSICRQLSVEATGDFLLCSGKGFIAHDAKGINKASPISLSTDFGGVICGINFYRAALKNWDYRTLLDEVKESLGLSSPRKMPQNNQLFLP